MEVITLCTVVASLRVLPNRSQFFYFDSISLSCGQQGSSSGWTLMRNTSRNRNQKCPTSWKKTNKSVCVINDLFRSDSGVYWCESGPGKCSNTINITVTAGSVILECPVLPVMKGEAVNLRCINKITSSSNLIANFYKGKLLIGSSSTGNLTIHSVSKSDEGLYRCNFSGGGQSPNSWLSVAGLPESPPSTSAHCLLPVVATYLSLASLMLLCLCRSHKGEVDPAVVLYTSTWKCDKQGEPLRSRSFLFPSAAVYRPVRWTYDPNPVLTYKPASDAF